MVNKITSLAEYFKNYQQVLLIRMVFGETLPKPTFGVKNGTGFSTGNLKAKGHPM
jgi:hypothetical protein